MKRKISLSNLLLFVLMLPLMPVLGIGGLLNGLLGGGRQDEPQAFGRRDYVNVTDGDAAYNTEAEVIALITATAHADFRLIWERTVLAQQRVAWGFGSAGLPHNQGYMWFASMDEGADWDIGRLRLQQSGAQGHKVLVLAQLPDNALHTTTVTTTETARPTDRNAMIALPEKVEYPVVREDSKIQLTYALLTKATTHDACAFDIPITVYE